jgi:murein DD-endopeptidase MepM/ murein hydrolase activator NlpD
MRHSLNKKHKDKINRKNKLLVFLTRSLFLKERHLWTRRNKLRLRYSVLPFLFVGLFVSAAFTFPQQNIKPAIKKSIISENEILANFEAAPPSFDKEKKITLASIEPQAGVQDLEKGSEAEDAIRHFKSRQKRLERYLPNINNITSKGDGKEQVLTKTEVKKVGSGDTVVGFLIKAGLDNKESYFASKALEKYYDPKRIKPGQEVKITYHSEGDDYSFKNFSFQIDPLKTVTVMKDDSGNFTSELNEKEAVQKLYAKKAVIDISLYGSALEAGIPLSVIADAIRVYSWDVDFQRDIRHGDSISILYERYETEEGLAVKGGNILFANLTVNGHEIPLYRFEKADGDVDYFKPDGSSARKTLMKTPIDGARISSGYGMRHHPVLGYNKMHKGVDFAAPRGTPIYAAGDGVVERASRNGGYGKYIRIRHNGSLKTAYAHLNAYGKGISTGKRVKQGQIIGYVGTTGRSTGPHLHYEVLKEGKQMDPAKLKLPQGEKLKGNNLTVLTNHIKEIDLRFVSLFEDINVVLAD